jgi:hypothetical protein
MKKYLFLALAGVTTFLVLTMWDAAVQSPEAKDQKVIAECWEESKGSNLTPAQQQVTIGACQALEKVYRLNYGISPFPGPKDV